MITEYVKGKPYFTDTATKIKQYPYLDKDISCDVAIVGGGIDGAIALYYLSKAGIDCVLIEKSRLGRMSTSCATALLEYQLDNHANDLTQYLKKEEIVECYKLGLKVLQDIDSFIKESGNACHYSARPTLMYTTKKGEVAELEREFLFRKENGFAVEWIDEENNPFPFSVKAGIFCPDGGAEFNPYLFEKQMLTEAESKGARIFENTEAIAIKYEEDGAVITTAYDHKIKCKRIVCATGYNTRLFTSKRLCEKFVSYTVVTCPIKNFEWHERALIQDNSDPYHYIRLSPDNRIIMGGEDIAFKNSTIKNKDAEKKYLALIKNITTMFPKLKNKFSIDYKFCGAFSSTLDNMAIMGPSKTNPVLWYCVGYGANGIIYSIVGAQMMSKLFFHDRDKNLYLFSPDRDLV